MSEYTVINGVPYYSISEVFQQLGLNDYNRVVMYLIEQGQKVIGISSNHTCVELTTANGVLEMSYLASDSKEFRQTFCKLSF